MSSVTLDNLSIYDPSAIEYVNKEEDADNLLNDFLSLLSAQLQYQDPLNPVENSEFTAQLAQFSMLGQQQESNTLLEELVAAQSGNQISQAVSYIGRKAVVEGDNVAFSDGEGVVGFDLDQPATVKVEIFDANGTQVGSVTTNATEAGEQFINIATELQDGIYSFEVSAQDSQGNEIAVTGLEVGWVTGVSNDSSNGTTIELNGHDAALDEVIAVRA